MQEMTSSETRLTQQGEDEAVVNAVDKEGAEGSTKGSTKDSAKDGAKDSSEVTGLLPPIPGKHYFTIGEMSRLCQIKPHVLRYWEHEFPQLKNVRRRGNRRYYTRQQVLVVRQIRSLLYEQGYTIPGAKARMAGQEEHADSSQSKQLIRQLKVELEDVLSVLKETDK